MLRRRSANPPRDKDLPQRERGWIGTALASLTTRGRSFLAGGLAATACAFILGQRDLLRIGVFLIALPLLIGLILARSHYRLALHRTITPARVTAGNPAKVRLELEHLSRGMTRVLMAEDEVPYALGQAPRFVISRLPGGRQAAVTYSVRSSARGLYDIGPLRLTMSDPFGLVEVTRSFTATDQLLVLPRTWRLSNLPQGGQWSGSGESSEGLIASGGDQDLTVREYRHGDEMRRVHWRSSARRGELMVRREEQPRERRATVLLDSRNAGHGGEGSTSSFEWAVEAAASVCSSLIEGRYATRLLSDASQAHWVTPSGSTGALPLLDRLATVTLSGPQTLRGQITGLGRRQGDGLMIAILGELDRQSAYALADCRSAGTRGIAILLRTWEWEPGQAHGPASGARHESHERCLSLLRAKGWSVADAGVRDSVVEVWQRAMMSDRAGAGSRMIPGHAARLSRGARL